MQKLKNHWASHRVKFNEGVPENFLAVFESQFSVVLPSDMREFFLAINGMPEDTTDEEMIRFWTLQEVKPLPTEAPEYATPDYIDNPESLFLFADYSIWVHAYAIRLGAAELKRNDIFLIGGDYPVLLFHSFSELIDSYLVNTSLMFSSQK